ncbi:MAG: zinc-dependent metalloprotease [Actinobacteria bacterium]|nr:zinc-dependent metalloprotease [Actinomycetota bacterium]
MMEGMLDRDLTQRIANAVARGTGTRGPAQPPPATLPGDLQAICADAEARVVAYTGLQPAAPLPAPESVQRATWIAANVNSMAAILDPLGDKLTGAGGLAILRAPARAAAGTLISAEAGAITGYLSQRVLGQYEFVLVDPSSRARLLFVAPNIAQAATRLRADAEELLTWIAFHEVTHAVQFSGVAWLRPYLAGLLGELLDSLEVKVDPRSLLRMPAVGDVRGAIAGLRENGLIVEAAGPAALHEVFAAPEQLPAPVELLDPGAWMRRVGVGAAA